MGQYRQWLHYRDVDRHLQAQREKVIQEITHLQQQVQRSEAIHPDASNGILHALIQHLALQSMSVANVAAEPVPHNSISSEVVQSEEVGHRQEEVVAFLDVNELDAKEQTDPQLSIPRWLDRTTSQSGSLDPQSVQTNLLVQRWLERWGKQQPEQAQSQTEGTALDTSLASLSINHEDTHS